MRPPPSSIFLLRSFIASALALALLALPLHAGKRWIPWTTAATGGASPPYDADFSGASNANPIGGDWESGLGANGQVKILSGEAVNVSGKGVASVKASALTINSNQRAEITLRSGVDDNVAPVIRMQSSGAHYQPFWSYTFSQGGLRKVDGSGTETEIGSRFFATPSPGLVFGIEANGSSIVVYFRNGGTRTDLQTYSDSDYTGGQPGFAINSGTSVVIFRAENY